MNLDNMHTKFYSNSTTITTDICLHYEQDSLGSDTYPLWESICLLTYSNEIRWAQLKIRSLETHLASSSSVLSFMYDVIGEG